MIDKLPHGQQGAFHQLYQLNCLFLSHNNISFIGPNTFSGLVNLKLLTLMGNPIIDISDFAFRGLEKIANLNLSSMLISSIQKRAFMGVLTLQVLDLSSNLLEEFNVEMLNPLTTLKWLYMQHNRIIQIDGLKPTTIFNNMVHISSDQRRLCCIANKLKVCDVPADDLLSNCRNLLSSVTLKIGVWVLSLGSFLTNIFVIAYRTQPRKMKRLNMNQNILLINLALSDILMSSYLCGLAVSDNLMRGVYAFQKIPWPQQNFCKVLGLIASVSIQMSLFSLALLSCLYFITFCGKKGIPRISRSGLMHMCILGWVVVIILCGMPLTGFLHITSASCLFLNFGSSGYKGWLYNLSLYVILNSLIISIIVFFCVWIVVIIYKSQMKVEQMGKTFGKASSYKAYMSLLVLLCSSLICWLPVEIILILSHSGVNIPPAFNTWLAVFLIPINSCTNPFIYTFRLIK